MFGSLLEATLLLTVFAFTNASPVRVRALVTPPTDDPFYTPESGYEAYPPGTILATRNPPSLIAALGAIPVPLADAQQILYRSTDSFGNPSATVATVLTPFNADESKLLSYQVAQDSAYANCAPSYALQFASDSGGLAGTLGTQVEIIAIGAALSEGWVVTIPDHEGPNAAFLANTGGGQHVLDGIRATLSSGLTTPQAQVALWGYSGGSLVSSFAAELAPTYAPELSSNLIGVVLGGAVPNITSSLPLINHSLFSGLLPGGIIGLGNEYPEIAALIDANLVPEKAADFNKARQQCFGANLIQFLGQDVLNDYFLDGDDFFFENSAVLAVQEANRLGQRAPQIPVFMYKGVQDQISAVEDTDQLYDEYCNAGGQVEYIRDVGAEHAALLVTGIPSAIQWIKGAFRGNLEAGCVKRDVVASLVDAAAQELKDTIRNKLGGFLGMSEWDIMVA
ncbi:uncharacterized protein HMPREF1541_06897 [Cyphellophora europaea CBS 101466]|uniref:Secretory lipase-domain-containing protein n=1 Tax=Cyphellophora europaea (strain CBS 101466) TaxID=1220924 RepID=W2RQR9_CYPE1|nr:uncharacterized protein HMPREF1541_06897 [Cyphellophora europaea CBS 101466]ETN38856.1 hypothetical protein HMPREF1541_06897 [Cyphellophora europaea CBS 101466]